MSDSFTKIYIQVVFAVKYRDRLILPSWEEDLYKYMTGIIQNKKQKMLAINGMPDHIHFLIRMKPTCCLSDLVRDVKVSADEFIKENKFTKANFQWQDGFGAFSYAEDDVQNVINYIMNQKQHHKNVSFKDEYIGFLNEFNIEYKPEHLFDWFD